MFLISRPNWAANPENSPKVATYMRVMYQVSGLEKMSICWRTLALTGTSLSRVKARRAATMVQGTKKTATLWTHTGPPPAVWGAIQVIPNRPNPMSQGPMSWIMLMPILPTPAWMPRAVPDRRLGKK